MKRLSATARCALVCAAALLAFPAPSPAPIPARQDRPPEPPGEQPAQETPGQVPVPDPLTGQRLSYETGQYLGPGPCGSPSCHGRAEPSSIYGIRQDEYTVWNDYDKHSTAFDLLWSGRSAQIARNLKLSRPAPASQLCLDCHVLRAPVAAQASNLETADGISCESCHGPAGGWIARHNDSGWTHADSLAAGMVDLRQPRLRAQLCLGCHQGDRRRQVGHELLAAGHPELAFELDTYTENMPQHWLPYAERSAAHGDGDLGDSHGLRAWAVGQVESFRAGLELLSHRAQSDQWPEFAEMTCDGCHHDLAGGAWRQRRGYRHRAGMPSWSPARYAVLRHLLAAVAAPAALAELDQSVEEVAAAFANLGAPERLVVASKRAAALLGKMSARVESRSWQGRAADQLLAAILADRAGAPGADRQSAEQTYFALLSLTQHLSDPRLARGKPARLVRQMRAQLDPANEYDRERFVGLLGELETALR